jgi:multimeric flavodoxin WrbA
MKIIGIACSPRKNKTSAAAVKEALAAARSTVPGVKTQLIEMAKLDVKGCIACGKCMKKLQCTHKDDFMKVIVPALSDEDLAGVIIGSPVYFQNMTWLAKILFDRAVMLRRNGFMLRDKVAGAISVGHSRNGGQELTLQAMHAAMLCQDMIVVSDGRPSAHLGGTLVNANNSIDGDEFGLATARGVGARVAEVAAKLHA